MQQGYERIEKDSNSLDGMRGSIEVAGDSVVVEVWEEKSMCFYAGLCGPTQVYVGLCGPMRVYVDICGWVCAGL